MASVRFGVAIADARGRCGDVVFARNRAGAYVRGWVDTPQPASEFRDKAQAVWAEVSRAWRDVLSPEQRGGWQAFAGLHLGENRLGEAVRLSGVAMFVQVNYRLRFCSEGWVLTAPGSWVAPVFGVVTFDMIAYEPQGSLVLYDLPALPEGCGMYVFATRPLVGTRRVQRCDWGCLNIGGNLLFPNGQDIGVMWSYRWGYLAMVAGDRVACCVRLVHRPTGAVSAPWVGETIVLPVP